MKANRQSGFSAIEIVIGVIVVVIIGLLGWKFFSSMQSDSQKNDLAQTSKAIELDTTNLAGLVDLATIKESALAGKDAATVTGIELRTQDGKLVYSATLSDGTVITFDATSGEKIATESEDKSDRALESIPATFKGGIGLAKAVEVAKSTMPGKIINKIEIESDDGIVLYSIRFTDEARVDINAETGAVVRAKTPSSSKKSSESKSSDDRNSTSDQSKDDDSTTSSGSGKTDDDSSVEAPKSTDDDSQSKSGSGSGSKTDDDSEDEEDLR